MTINLPPANSANHSSSSPIPFSPTASTTEGKILHTLPPRLMLADQMNHLIKQKNTKRSIVFPPNRPATSDPSGLPCMHLETKDSSSSSSSMPLISLSQVTMRPLSLREQVKRLQAERASLSDNRIESDPLSHLLCVGAKGSIDPRARALEYGGMDDLNQLNNRANHAESLLEEVEARKTKKQDPIQGIRKVTDSDATDIEGLRRICANRFLQLHQTQKIRDYLYTKNGQAYRKVVDALVRLKNDKKQELDYEEIQVSIKEAIDSILDRLHHEAKQPTNSKTEIQAAIQIAIDYATLRLRSQQEVPTNDVKGGNRTFLKDEISSITSLLNDKAKQQRAESAAARQKHIQELIANIHLLDDPTSHRIITLSNGITLFPLPGGASEHFVCYEFRKNKEEYEIVIHDRSGCSSAVAAGMQGTICVQVDGKVYQKTSLAIKTSKAALTNPRFIESVLSDGSHVPYAEICLFLIELGRGEVVQSEIEPLIDRLEVYREIGNSLDKFFTSILEYSITSVELGSLIALLLKRDKYFHSMQMLRTCTESNSTEIEKQMAPGSVRKALKLHEIKITKTKLSERLTQIKDKKGSDIVCAIKRSDYNARITKTQYQKDIIFVHELVAQKEAHLAAKLSGKTPRFVNLKETLRKAKDILNRLDACMDPVFVALKEKAQEKINARKPKLKKYLVEHNQDMHRYLALVPDEWRCNADFMLSVLTPHPQHTNPWSSNLQSWFTAWTKALHPDLSNSEDTILKAVAINPMALKAASARLKDNESFITRICEMHATSEALRHITPWALIHASSRIRTMPQYIDKLPAFPTDETTKECLENLIPDDIIESQIFKRKFNTSSRTSCSIQ